LARPVRPSAKPSAFATCSDIRFDCESPETGLQPFINPRIANALAS
jgi:hypothetical protein